MQGVRIRDEKGNILLSQHTSTAVILGSFVLPAGSANGARVQVGVEAPEGVDFTKSKPFVFCTQAPGVLKWTYKVSGNTVFAGYQTYMDHPYLLVQYGVIESSVTPTYCEVAAFGFRSGAIEDLTFYYGYA